MKKSNDLPVAGKADKNEDDTMRLTFCRLNFDGAKAQENRGAHNHDWGLWGVTPFGGLSLDVVAMTVIDPREIQRQNRTHT